MISNDKDQRPREHVAGIILAAGRSERMGAFKPLLPFGKTTVIDSCLEHLRAGGVETVVVVVGHRAEEMKKHLKNSGVLFAVNPDPDGEMSSSIACGVRELPRSALAALITPVDHPAVPPEVVSQLISEWKKGERLIKPTFARRGGHPVVVDLTFRQELLSLDSNRGLKGLFAEQADQVKRLPVNSDYIARDMDTWDDYAALHRDVFGILPASRPAKTGRPSLDGG